MVVESANEKASHCCGLHQLPVTDQLLVWLEAQKPGGLANWQTRAFEYSVVEEG
jgi:hypothetical protein